MKKTKDFQKLTYCKKVKWTNQGELDLYTDTYSPLFCKDYKTSSIIFFISILSLWNERDSIDFLILKVHRLQWESFIMKKPLAVQLMTSSLDFLSKELCPCGSGLDYSQKKILSNKAFHDVMKEIT